jgi:transcriptional regulator with XRE-family HTH domain
MRRPEAAFASPASIAASGQLGAAIRLARLARNLTQADFAERARMSVATLQRIERGDPAVSFSSWLSAMEVSNLLPILQRAADPDADAAGRARRQLEQRKRATGSRGKDAEEDPYAF